MPATLDNSGRSLLASNLFRFAKLWRITRADGVVLRYTDNAHALVTGNETYIPGDFDASASESRSGFKDSNVELRGFLSADAITDTDLRAGVYRGAEIEVFTVDHRYPWATVFRTDVMLVESVRYTGELWEVRVLGLAGVLQQPAGRTLNRDCDANVGDTRCGVDLEAHRVAGTISTVVEARRKFTTSLTGTDGLYDLGEITWTSGANNGLTSEVKTYLNTGGALTLQVRAPHPVSAADSFTIVPGCAGIRDHCKGTSGVSGKPWATNIARFRGYPDMPGTTALMNTPDSK